MVWRGYKLFSATEHSFFKLSDSKIRENIEVYQILIVIKQSVLTSYELDTSSKF